MSDNHIHLYPPPPPAPPASKGSDWSFLEGLLVGVLLTTIALFFFYACTRPEKTLPVGEVPFGGALTGGSIEHLGPNRYRVNAAGASPRPFAVRLDFSLAEPLSALEPSGKERSLAITRGEFDLPTVVNMPPNRRVKMPVTKVDMRPTKVDMRR